MAGPFGAFEWTFEWLGDTLINKVGDEIFGDGGAARQTIMVVYNHGNQDHFYLSISFESGGFTAATGTYRELASISQTILLRSWRASV